MQRPSYYNPYRHPEQTRERRNLILSLMRQNGFITDREYAVESEAPLDVVSGGLESTDAPYFVDLVNDELSRSTFQDRDFQASSYRIYTTLDLNLQRAAAEAVRIGMQQVDDQLKKQRRHKNVAFPDVAGRADRHRPAHRRSQGAGGRPQLRHEPAEPHPRQAAAGVDLQALCLRGRHEHGRHAGAPVVLTPASIVMDEPTTFWFDDKPYEPNNFTQEILWARSRFARPWPIRSTSPP